MVLEVDLDVGDVVMGGLKVLSVCCFLGIFLRVDVFGFFFDGRFVMWKNR